MKKLFYLLLAAFLTAGFITGCSDDEVPEPENPPIDNNNGNGGDEGDNEGDDGDDGDDGDGEEPGSELIALKDLFADMFPVGAAVGHSGFLQPGTLQQASLLTHFNSVTAENCMKPDALQPRKGQYNWDEADRLVQFAEQNGIRVRGHVLTWHGQTADWMFYDNNRQLLSKEVALKQLEEHITTVVSRYKGKIYAWDVVNEACHDWDAEGKIIYREDSPWYKICGDASFIDSAFVYAHRADPEAKLFYNDYNEIYGWKNFKIAHLIRTLQENGTPIHGVGMQGHWSVGTNEQEVRQSLDMYSKLGIEIQITELDVSVYDGWAENPIPNSTVYTEEMERQQIDAYKMIFKIFADYKDVISGVTFWGIADDNTWLDEYEHGKKAFPFLLDVDHQPKAAYYAVQEMIQEINGK